jgi:hypothetical protein
VNWGLRWRGGRGAAADAAALPELELQKQPAQRRDRRGSGRRGRRSCATGAGAAEAAGAAVRLERELRTRPAQWHNRHSSGGSSAAEQPAQPEHGCAAGCCAAGETGAGGAAA